MMGGGHLVQGEINVARVKPPWLYAASTYIYLYQCTKWLGCIPPVSGGHQLPWDCSASASHPANGVHQARISRGIMECGMHFDENNGIGWTWKCLHCLGTYMFRCIFRCCMSRICLESHVWSHNSDRIIVHAITIMQCPFALKYQICHLFFHKNVW